MGFQIKPVLAVTILWSSVLIAANPAQAFCGFYVAKADAQLFNKASKVVVARKGDRTAITMASDYQGDPKEFALSSRYRPWWQRSRLRCWRARWSTTSTPTALRAWSSTSMPIHAINRQLTL